MYVEGKTKMGRPLRRAAAWGVALFCSGLLGFCPPMADALASSPTPPQTREERPLRRAAAWAVPLVCSGLLGFGQPMADAMASSPAPPETREERLGKRTEILKQKHGLTDYDQGPQPAKITHPHYPKAAFKDCI